MSKTDAQKSKDYLIKAKEKGIVPVKVMIPENYRDVLMELARDMRQIVKNNLNHQTG